MRQVSCGNDRDCESGKHCGSNHGRNNRSVRGSDALKASIVSKEPASKKKMHLQSIIFSKEYTKGSIVKWLRQHHYKWALDEKANTWRARQFDPALCVKSSFRTIHLEEGVLGVVAKLK